MYDRLSERAKLWVQLAVVAVLVAAAVLIMLSLGLTRTKSDVSTVAFRVDSSGGFANITLQAGKVRISKTTTVTVPWKKTVTIASGTEVYLTASNPTQTGKLSCSITLNGQSWKSASTSAPKDGVACAGIVP